MKKLLLIGLLSLFVVACSTKEEDRLISEKIENKNSDYFKDNPIFSEFCLKIEQDKLRLNEEDKEKFKNVTYKQLYEFNKSLTDNDVLLILSQRWDLDYDEYLRGYFPEVDNKLFKYQLEFAYNKYSSRIPEEVRRYLNNEYSTKQEFSEYIKMFVDDENFLTNDDYFALRYRRFLLDSDPILGEYVFRFGLFGLKK